MNIMIFGPPGAGKGTQSRLISEKYGLKHISTGDMLAAEIKLGSDLGKEVSYYMENATFAPDDLVNRILKSTLEKINYQYFLLDGYPRNTAQVDYLHTILNGNKISHAILLEVQDDIVIKRMKERQKVEKRADCDSDEKLVKRLEDYQRLTEPVIQRYKEFGLLKVVDGSKSILEISSSISDLINQNK